MTGDPVIDLLISAAGIAALVAFAFAIGARRTVRVGRDNALERLAFDEPDFRPGRVLIGEAGEAAAALSADGRELALIFAVGDGLVTRRRAVGDIDVTREGATLLFLLNEPSRRRVRLRLASEADARAWLSEARAAGV